MVTKRETLKALIPVTPYMKWLENAATAVIIIGNPDLSKYWVQDATLSGGFLWLTAVSLGLGAARGAVYHSEDPEESARRESFVREQLAIPNHYRVVSIIGLGFPAKEPPLRKCPHWNAFFTVRHTKEKIK